MNRTLASAIVVAVLGMGSFGLGYAHPGHSGHGPAPTDNRENHSQTQGQRDRIRYDRLMRQANEASQRRDWAATIDYIKRAQKYRNSSFARKKLERTYVLQSWQRCNSALDSGSASGAIASCERTLALYDGAKRHRNTEDIRCNGGSGCDSAMEVLRGRIALLRGDDQSALAHYRRAVELPRPSAAASQGLAGMEARIREQAVAEQARAAAAARAVVAQRAAQKAATELQEATALLDRGRPEAATRRLERALRDAPDDARLKVALERSRAETALARGDRVTAENHLRAALQINPADTAVASRLARVAPPPAASSSQAALAPLDQLRTATSTCVLFDGGACPTEGTVAAGSGATGGQAAPARALTPEQQQRLQSSRTYREANEIATRARAARDREKSKSEEISRRMTTASGGERQRLQIEFSNQEIKRVEAEGRLQQSQEKEDQAAREVLGPIEIVP